MNNTYLYLMSGLYVFTGITHFIKPRMFKRIIPPFLPWQNALVYTSGAAEIILGLLLIPETTRSIAAWGLICLLIAVFPANIYMAQIFYKRRHRYLPFVILRLPLQFILIWWAWLFT